MTDITARLDAAITEAREAVWDAIAETDCTCGRSGHLDWCATQNDKPVNDALDRWAALVALRARLDEIGMHVDDCFKPHRRAELTAEAERLLGEDA